MGEFTFQCSIDGQDYSLELLAMVRYQRDIHVLHEMQRAGATVEYDGRTLSHDDVNLLGAEEAFAVSVAVRNSYDQDGIRRCSRRQLQASEQRWREWNAGLGRIAAPRHALPRSRSRHFVRGIYREHETQAPFLQNYPALHPDHFFISKDGETLKGVETFGMYGGPSEMVAFAVQHLSVPIERDENLSFRLRRRGDLGGRHERQCPAFKQFKPLENGLASRRAAAFPRKRRRKWSKDTSCTSPLIFGVRESDRGRRASTAGKEKPTCQRFS